MFNLFQPKQPEKPNSPLFNIPSDILALIIAKLPLRDVARMRQYCKYSKNFVDQKATNIKFELNTELSYLPLNLTFNGTFKSVANNVRSYRNLEKKRYSYPVFNQNDYDENKALAGTILVSQLLKSLFVIMTEGMLIGLVTNHFQKDNSLVVPAIILLAMFEIACSFTKYWNEIHNPQQLDNQIQRVLQR